MVAAIVVAVVVLLAAVGVVILAYRSFNAGKRIVGEKIELHRAEAERLAAKEAMLEPVELTEGELPVYAGFQPGDPLDRGMYLAWRVDEGATTLARGTFREKIEGAEVSWALRAGDIRRDGDRITGSFYLPYVVKSEDGHRKRAGVESVRCEFAPGERETLLAIRRDEVVTIRGKLSLKGDELLILDARQAGAEVEK